MVNCKLEGRGIFIIGKVRLLGLLVFSSFFSIIKVDKAVALSIVTSDLSSGYANCSYYDNGTTGTFKVAIYYKPALGHTGMYDFASRGLVVYVYSKDGVLDAKKEIGAKVSLNGVLSSASYKGDDYIMYQGRNAAASSSWRNAESFTANYEVVIDNKYIKDWPSIGLRAGNYTNGDDVVEVGGIAYVGPKTKGGSCDEILNPEQPPAPVNPVLNMTAPDWDLGEMIRGETTEKTLISNKDQLCFTYDGAAFNNNQKYKIHAVNQNSTWQGIRYIMKADKVGGGELTYQLSLMSNGQKVLLPNFRGDVVSLNKDGRTCFVPTFNVITPNNAKAGTFSDVLTFTVISET